VRYSCLITASSTKYVLMGIACIMAALAATHITTTAAQYYIPHACLCCCSLQRLNLLSPGKFPAVVLNDCVGREPHTKYLLMASPCRGSRVEVGCCRTKVCPHLWLPRLIAMSVW
jgi:hypothetical protein